MKKTATFTVIFIFIVTCAVGFLTSNKDRGKDPSSNISFGSNNSANGGELQNNILENNSNGLLEKTPVDAVYVYADVAELLREQKRSKAIEKDFDNDELRYSLRSIFENAPWIRKIFIITPNKKISFLKKQCEDDRIVLIDQDALLDNMPTQSCITIEHSGLRKLDKFGVSENFLYFCDDYFICRPVLKSDFFYTKDNEVLPFVLYDSEQIKEYRYEEIKKQHKVLRHMYERPTKQSSTEYLFQTLNAKLFLFEALGKKSIFLYSGPYPHHNIFGLKISDVKEIYDVANSKYQYKQDLFKSFKRSNKQFTYEFFYSFYSLNKYKRRTSNGLARRHIELNMIESSDNNNDCKLLCINTPCCKCSDMCNIFSKILMLKSFKERFFCEEEELKDGEYKIKNLKTNKVITATKDGKVVFAKNQNSEFQKFKITFKDGTFVIENLAIKKVLCVNNGSAIVTFSDFTNDDAQKWYISTFKNKKVFFIASKVNELLLKNQGTFPKVFSAKNAEDFAKYEFVKI